MNTTSKSKPAKLKHTNKKRGSKRKLRGGDKSKANLLEGLPDASHDEDITRRIRFNLDELDGDMDDEDRGPLGDGASNQ